MEEDIKILEILKESYAKASGCGLGYPSDNREDKRIAQALENLIKGYRELEEERRMFYRGNVYTANQLKNSIPKSKIKEKIEELDNASVKEEYVFYKLSSEDIRRTIKTVLQELMEEK